MREAPTLTVDPGVSNVQLNWTAVSDHWPGTQTITYQLYRGGTEVTGVSGRRHTDTPATGVIHRYQVVALVDGVASSRSALEAASIGVQYDTDRDNLIDIRNLDQLNAVRHDLNGVGDVDDNSDPATEGSDAAIYAAAFPNDAVNMGCDPAC